MDGVKKRIRNIIRDSTNDNSYNESTAVAVSIVYKDQVYKYRHGIFDSNRQIPVDSKTLFPVASITKSFTALSIVLLLKKKQIGLDSPVNTCKPYIELIDPDINKKLTFRDMLTHMTGLPSNDLLWYFSDYSTNRLLTSVKAQELIPNAVGTDFNYNNLIYAAFQTIVEDLSKLTFSKYMHQSIFTKFGMTQTKLIDDDSIRFSNNAACDDIDMLLRKIRSICGASGVISNLDDLTNYLIQQIYPNDLNFQDVVKFTHTKNVNIKAPNPIIFNGLEWIDNPGYGLGWFIGGFHDSKIVFVMGLIDGFTSLIAFLPEHKIGGVILTNLNLSPIPGHIVNRVFSALLGCDSANINPKHKEERPENDSAEIYIKLSVLFNGKFKDSVYGVIGLKTLDEKYFMQYFDNTWEVFFHTEEEGFFYVEFAKIKLRLPVYLNVEEKELISLSIPFSLDERVPDRKFTRLQDTKI